MRLDELSRVERATVLTDAGPVGGLRRTGVDVEFQYRADFAGDPIATTLPVRPEPHSTGRPGSVPPFFAGLLPEGRRLTALRRAVKTSADDDLTLLLAVGTDSARTRASASKTPMSRRFGTLKMSMWRVRLQTLSKGISFEP